MRQLLGALALALALSGCSSIGTLSATEPAPVYDLDLKGTIDGVPWDGIAVGDISKTHDIKIESKTDVNYFVIESCHRWEKYEDAIVKHWYQPSDAKVGYEYTYNEAPGIEDTGKCVLRLYAFSKQIGAGQAYGLMLFKNPKFQLPAENICNGADGQTGGTSICKSYSGLKERIRFKTQVITANPNADGTLTPNQCKGNFIDATTWEYVMPLGECMIVFGSTDSPHQFHVHMAYGFNKSQYRGAN